MVILTDEQAYSIQWRLDKAQEMLDNIERTIKDMTDEKRSLEREVAVLREQNRIFGNTNSLYSWLLYNLDKMRQDYAAHRGRYGGTGVADEITKLVNGSLYETSDKEETVNMVTYSKPARVLNSFEDLLGETLRGVEVKMDDTELHFTLVNGEVYRLYHSQDCCESVYIEDICGDLSDLVGSPILMAEEVSNSDDPPVNEWSESYTWTFYKLATINGYVTIRWYGSSNGYYSERVDWELIKGPDPARSRSAQWTH